MSRIRYIWEIFNNLCENEDYRVIAIANDFDALRDPNEILMDDNEGIMKFR